MRAHISRFAHFNSSKKLKGTRIVHLGSPSPVENVFYLVCSWQMDHCQFRCPYLRRMGQKTWKPHSRNVFVQHLGLLVFLSSPKGVIYSR